MWFPICQETSPLRLWSRNVSTTTTTTLISCSKLQQLLWNDGHASCSVHHSHCLPATWDSFITHSGLGHTQLSYSGPSCHWIACYLKTDIVQVTIDKTTGNMVSDVTQPLLITSFLPRDAIHSADYAVPGCLSVRPYASILPKQLNFYHQTFSSSGSHTILVFPYQTVL